MKAARASSACYSGIDCIVDLAQVLRTIGAAGESGRIEALLKRGEDLFRETGVVISLPSIHE